MIYLKKCAENNSNRFFYFDRKNYLFVDQYKNKINNSLFIVNVK